MEKKETPQRNLRRFFVVGREPEKVTFRFAERYASFNFSGTFRFADYTTYIFPKDKSVKKYTVEFDTPVEHTLTFTPKVKQCILAFTLYTDATSSIAGITVDNKLMADTNIYDLSGRVVAQKGSEGLKKGIYIFNNKKFVVK